MKPNMFCREIVKEYTYDVVIVGGGTTGACAALAAAKSGAKTSIVEMNGYLGGVACGGQPWMAFDKYTTGEQIVRGIPREIIERLQKKGYAGNIHMDPIVDSTVWVNTTALKIELAIMMEEAGVRQFLHTCYAGLEMEQNRVQGIYILNKQGVSFIQSGVVIDSTESGDVVRDTGTKYYYGRETDNKPQASSTTFRIGNVDMEKFISYFEHNPDQMRPHKMKKEALDDIVSRLRTTHSFVLGAFPELIRQAKENGVEFPRDRFIGVAFPKINEIVTVAPRVQNVDPFDNENFTESEIKGYMQVEAVMQFVREYMPGGENAYPVADNGTIGIRETNHFEGEHVLQDKEMLEGKKFDDRIAVGSYYFDVHTPDEGRQLGQMIRPPVYYIPYSALIPKERDGILMAGRHLSATSLAESGFRVIPILASIGQGAGTAAALTVRDHCRTTDVNIKEVQAILEKDGVRINDTFIKDGKSCF
jgi:hypothetical protein